MIRTSQSCRKQEKQEIQVYTAKGVQTLKKFEEDFKRKYPEFDPKKPLSYVMITGYDKDLNALKFKIAGQDNEMESKLIFSMKGLNALLEGVSKYEIDMKPENLIGSSPLRAYVLVYEGTGSKSVLGPFVEILGLRTDIEH